MYRIIFEIIRNMPWSKRFSLPEADIDETVNLNL